ncbi:MAG TPA: hypothetical protein VGI75_10785, partial [Pirellulales bacterium]
MTQRRWIFLRLQFACAMIALCATGCNLLPKHHDDEKAKEIAAADAAAAKAAEAAKSTSSTTPAEMTAILAEVQQLGALDPAAQNALIEDLKKTDPALWPQLM